MALVIDGVSYTDDVSMAQALGEEMKALRGQPWGTGDRLEVARFAGLPVKLVGGKTFVGDYEGPFGLFIGDKWRQKVAPYLKGERVLDYLKQCVAEREKDLEHANAKVKSARRQRPMVEMQSQGYFEHSERLAEVRARIEALELELGLAKEDASMAAVGETAAVVNNTSVQGDEETEGAEGAQVEEAVEAA
jgi:hypothetical protein